jgi:large subunit ribosomal protein L17
VRHNVYGKKLGRNKNERSGLFKNLVQSLLTFEKIETTQAKAKAIKGLVDKIINQAKTPSTRRLVSQFLVDKKTQEKLINEVLPRLQTRNSGYTSTIKVGRRLGDGAMMVQIKLLLEDAKKETKGSRETKEPKVEKVEAVRKSESKESEEPKIKVSKVSKVSKGGRK